jgi:hypothetical protein
MDAMNMPVFDPKISAGNIVTWIIAGCGLVATIVWVQADIQALAKFEQEARSDIRQLKEQRGSDREALLEIKGDIRVIRQILEPPRAR